MEVVIEKLIAAFRPGESLLSWRKLSGGHIHQSLYVSLPSGEWVIQGLNTHIFPDIQQLMKNFGLIRRHLRTKDFPYLIPEYVPWADGEMLTATIRPDQSGLIYWRIMPYFKGMKLKMAPANEADVAAAGRAIGMLSRYLSDLNPRQLGAAIPRFFDPQNWYTQFEEALKMASAERKAKATGLIRALQEGEAYAAPVKVPVRVIHGDAKIPNFLYTGQGELRVILDWDTAMPATVLDEFGYLARSLISRKAEDDPDPTGGYLNPAYLEILLKTFRETAGDALSQTESDQLIRGVKRTIWLQAVRFLADYLGGDQYYPVEYSEHNLVRAQNQFGLLMEVKHSFPD
ncbi:MAG: aminoglycoside phosphotransferase family protein [Bacteroidetes bacterium]|nr:aminoglycoside phosphotransferase family protein [Bacteroidota bacterium]